jgi:hypothetical protein
MSQTSPKSHPGPAFALPKVFRAVSANIHSFFLFFLKYFCKLQMQGSTAPMIMGPNTTTMSYGHHHPQSQQQQVHNLQTVGHSGLDFKPLESSAEASLGRTMSAPVIGPVSSLDAFGDNLSQLSSGWEGELQSVVNMGFLQGRLSTWLPQESHCIFLLS